jgi:hypothetical protein
MFGMVGWNYNQKNWITGKTLLAKTLARFVNVPFVIADATTLTQVKTSHWSPVYTSSCCCLFIFSL